MNPRMLTKRMARLPAIAMTASSQPQCVHTAQNASGSLRGAVQDSAKARVAGAAIELDLTGSAQTRHATADSEGEFRIEDLTPGSWHVSVEARGFATASADVSVAVSTVRSITVTLAAIPSEPDG